MALDYEKLHKIHKKRDEENWEKEKNSQKVPQSKQSPGVKSSGSGNIYEVGAQRRRTNVDSREIEAKSVNSNKRATGRVDMAADAQTAAMAKKMQGMTDAERQKYLLEYASTPRGTKQADTVLKNKQMESARKWAQTKANYNENKQATVNTPMNEKLSRMTEEELQKDVEKYEALGSNAKQVTDLIGTVARDELDEKELKEKQQIREEGRMAQDELNYRNSYASSKKTAEYQDKFYSMSEAEKDLVATVTAFNVGGASRVSGEAYDKARNTLKNEYGYTDDDITAMTYFYNRYANAQKAQDDEINARLAMDEHPFLESVASVPVNLAGGVVSAFGAAQSRRDIERVKGAGITDQTIDYNNPLSKWQRDVASGRDEFTDTHDWMIGDYDVGDMLYNTAMSGAESFVSSFMPGGAVMLGVNAASSKINELSQRGISADKALVGGIVSGAFEAMFEQVSIGQLTAFQEMPISTIKDVVMNIGKSVVTNFTEEAATEIANMMYDEIAHGDKSQRQMQINRLVASGKYTPEEAEKEVLKGELLQIVEAGASGALMGGFFGATGSAMGALNNYAETKALGGSVKDSKLTTAVIAEGQAAPAGSKTKKLADSLAAKNTEGKKISDYKAGKLVEQNAKVTNEASKGEFKDAQSKEELTEAYEEKKLEIANDDSLSKAEKSKKLEDTRKQFENAVSASDMKASFAQKLGRELAEVDRAEATNPTAVIDGKSVTIDGGNFDAKTKSFGEFKGIFKDKDGDIAVKTTDGTQIKVSELKTVIKDKTVARLYEKAEGLSAQAANLFIDNYDGESIDEYGRAFDYYYKMGRTGLGIDKIRENDNRFGNYLSAEAQVKIAAEGLKDREFRKGFTDFSVTRKTERYRFESRVLQYIGEKRNLEIFVIDEDSNINGTYLTGTNRIVIRRNAEGKLLLRTASHESFHFIKNQIKDEAGKAELQKLENFVLDVLQKNGTDIEAEIRRLSAITDDAGNAVYATREDCVEEIVANSMFDAFMNEKFVKKAMNENASLFTKISNKVKELLADIRAAVKALSVKDAAVRALKDDIESLEKINAMFDSLLEKAGENYKAENGAGQKNNADDGVKYSIQTDSQGDYVKVDVEQNIFDNKNVREMQSIARKIINQNYKGKVLKVGVEGKAYINKRSADEYAYPANRRMDDSIKEVKMRSSTELDNLLAVSKFVNNEPDDGRHPDATGGWDIYETRFEVANTMFSGEIKIKVTNRGFVFHDVTQIKRLPVNGNQTKTNLAVASGNLLNNSISEDSETVKQKLSVKASAETLSELKEKREGLVAEYRELRTQIDAIKESDEYKAFDNEVRTVRKNGSKFGGFEAVKAIRNRQKQWAEAAGLSALEERYDDISGQIHDYDLEIYKADKELKAKATAQLTEKVSKFSRDEIMDYAKKAAAKFGITKKFDNAGYMLPDGGLLDFSDGQGYRVLDHREIRDVLDFLPEDGNRSDGLIQFMNMGNIRMQIGGIDISRAPTKEQIAELRRFFDKNNGEITVDFSKDNGDNAGTIEYPAGTSSIRILNDIKKYFESGELPQISATAAFHSMYSQKQQSGIQAYWAETVRENHSFRNILSLLGEMQIAGGKVQLSSKDIDRIVRDTLKSTSSAYDKTKLTDELTVLYDYLANSGGNADTEEIYTSLLNIANGILEQSEMKDSELFDQYKNVRDYLRTQPIYITPAVKKEIESQFGDYKSFRNILMGKAMRLSTTNENAATLDEVWQELSELAPEYFPKDMNELDMPMQLTAFFEAIAPKVVNPYEHFQENIEDAAAELATDIFQKYFEIGRLKNPQEKYRNLVFENMKKLEQSKKEMRSEFRKKAALDAEGYRTRIAEYKLQREQGDKRRRLRNEIDRNYNYLNRRIVKETDSDHVPEKLKSAVSAFLQVVPDYIEFFSKGDFAIFENEYRKLEETSTFFDEGMAQRIAALGERLTPGVGAPRMRELDNYELEELRNITEHIKYVVQNENRLFSESNKGRVEDYAKAIHSELKFKMESKAQGVPDTKYKGRYKDVAYNGIDALIKGFTKPEYLFESVGSPTVKKLFDALRKGENTEARIIFDAKKAETEIKKKYGYDPRWNQKNIDIQLEGDKVSVTVETALALYATSKRKQGLEHLLGGGAAIYTTKEKAKDVKTYAEIKKEVIKTAKKNKEKLSLEEIEQRTFEKYKEIGEVDRKTTYRRVHFKESDISKISEALTNEQKLYADAMVDYITKEIGAKRNEVSLKLIGVERYKESYYFPIKVDRHFVDTSVGRQEVVATIRNQSSAKRTVDHAQNPIEITGFTDTVNNHIYDSALYCAYVLPINDFKRVYNYRDKELTGDGLESMMPKDVSIKEDIRRTNGVNAIKQIEDFMVALDSGSRYENLIPLSAKMMSRAKKFSVMANLSTVVQQPTAVFRAMLYVNPKYFATWANKADIEEMKKYNGCALKKEIGYFDVNMGRTATDYMNEYTADKEVKKDYSITDRMRNANIMLKADQLAGWGASKADEQTWGAIWKACKKQVKAENGELQGDALNTAAAELFQTVISKTQVYDSAFTKPDYMRRKEGLAMMTTAFMSEPLTSLNMLAEAVVNARNAKGSTKAKEAAKFCARAFGCYAVSLVVNNAVKSLIYTMRDDEEDESILEQYVANVLDGMVGDVIGMVPYIKDILSIMQGYDPSRMDAAAFTTIIDAVKSLWNENKSIEDKIMLMLKAAGQASGIPLYNVTRDAKAIIGFGNKIADGIKNGFEPTTGRGMLNEIKETFEWVPFVEADSKYSQLYKAITEGDGRHYQKIYNNLIADGKDDGTINGGIATELEKHDLRIADAYYATASGETVKASGIISELEGEGFSKDVINRALKKYEDNLKKRLDDDERVIKAAEARYNMDYDEYERIVDELVAEGHSEKIVKDKINSEKIELETKEDDFEVNEKPMYAASYDLKNAIINGDASNVRTVYRKLLSETDAETANSEVRKYAAQAYKNGDISESQLTSYYTSYKSEGDDENDIFWKVEDVKGGDGYRKYGKLYDAIEYGRNISGTIDYYTSHGVELKTVKSNITSEYKPKLTRLTPGTAEYNELYEKIIDAFVAAGDTEAAAIKKVKKWRKDDAE